MTRNQIYTQTRQHLLMHSSPILCIVACALNLRSGHHSIRVSQSHNMSETIYLGAGCYWCVEAVYQRVVGVQSIVSGFMGGSKANPTYKEVMISARYH